MGFLRNLLHDLQYSDANFKFVPVQEGIYQGRRVEYYVRNCSERCGQLVIADPDTGIAIGILPGLEHLDNYKPV